MDDYKLQNQLTGLSLSEEELRALVRDILSCLLWIERVIYRMLRRFPHITFPLCRTIWFCRT